MLKVKKNFPLDESFKKKEESHYGLLPKDSLTLLRYEKFYKFS